MSAGLVVENLSVSFGEQRVLDRVSLQIEAGRAVALVGESGSGKSVLARTLVGLTGSGAQVSAGALRYDAQDLLNASQRTWRQVRGRQIGFVLQDALVSLDPLRPVGKEIEESLAVHGWGDRQQRAARAVALLESLGVPEPAVRARQRADQLSGGQRQRALIASALALDPPLLIADEPTTALDATVQAQVVEVLQRVKAQGRSLLLISHDLAMVAQLADEVLVIRQGVVLERGPIGQILRAPKHPYTRLLLDSQPHRRAVPARSSRWGAVGAGSPAPTAPAADTPLLEANGLCKRYRGPDHAWRQVVDDVSFSVRAARTLGVVGESGSGKSTTARLILGLAQPERGAVRFMGQDWNAASPLALSERSRRGRRGEMGVVYQDPLSSFDPRWSVGQILDDALPDLETDRGARDEQVAVLLQQVRLPADVAGRRPLHLSGGQRQRVAIARALAHRPRLIVCDEPVSALDVSVQSQVLDLLAELQRALGIAYVFISHDLAVVRQVSDEVAVMYQGRIVEQGPVELVFSHPEHAYTRRLLAALPPLAA